ncbi:MAG: lytic murein transglycosylase, partial [Desulfobacterales bacterium]|nr:lytic murein transglycosylase [Desulfobacterales bacterium]
SAATLDAALSGITPIERVVELDRRQPEFLQTFSDYLGRRVDAQQVARGQALLAEHAALLDAVEQRYGVPKTVLVAFWGLETNYGSTLGSLNIPGDTTGWLRIGAPIAASLPKLQDVTGIYLKMWSGDPASGQTGTAVFWLDNVIFQADQRTTPPPPPTLSIQPAKAGLQMFASAGGAQYQRQNIRTVESGYSWVGRPGPVSYVLTLGSYPDSAHSGFQSQIFLVPSETPPTESSPDWNQPNVVFLDIGNNNSGGAYATLRYKTNQPSGNSMYYNSNPDNGPVGVLTSVNSATPVGAWSLGFDGANVTLTAPDGTSSTVEFPAASAALFADPLYAFFGVQPNQLANIGQSALFTRVQISGVATPLD